MKFTILLTFMMLTFIVVRGQDSRASIYDPRDLFPASPMLPAGNSYRSATGEPGENYWQNTVDYTIDALLDDKQNKIEGTETITYTNNSPRPLFYLWLQLDQNAFKKGSRALNSKLFLDSTDVKVIQKPFVGGFEIHSIEFELDNIETEDKNAEYLVDDTRTQLLLSPPLASGKKISIKINYSFRIPQFFYNADFHVNRTDILPTTDGAIYSIAQWYPRLCVLDDVEGWNTLPYLGNGEFYLEYGNFDVNITLPSEYVVQASGELLNPEEVLTPIQLKRWKEAQNSETRIFIRTPEEVTEASSRPRKPTCTWKFKIDNSRDFAWTASRSFVWEGIRINLPEGKKAFGISLYPIESKKTDSWERSSEYVKWTIEHFSKKWYPYPYPSAVNVASNLDGMEYPGIIFCSAKDTGNSFWRVVKHEFGHTWFPMIVGGNERKYAWMDEGFNTFIDNMADGAFNNGEFKGYGAIEIPPEDYFSDSLPPILTRPDALKNSYAVFVTQYLKPAYLLSLLRNQIIGEERFDRAFKKYIQDWAFRHPTPRDFFRSINNTTGEDLTWFWKAMFLENYKLDQGVKAMEYIDNDPSKGASITITNFERAAMPLILAVTTENGNKEIHTLPVEIWEHNNNYVFTSDTTERIEKIEIDPDKVYPDINRVNNHWKK